jgi:hypothetical protein
MNSRFFFAVSRSVFYRVWTSAIAAILELRRNSLIGGAAAGGLKTPTVSEALASCEGDAGDLGSDAAAAVAVAVVGSSVALRGVSPAAWEAGRGAAVGTPISPTAVALATAASGEAGEGAPIIAPSNSALGGVEGEGAAGETPPLTPAGAAPPLTSAL